MPVPVIAPPTLMPSAFNMKKNRSMLPISNDNDEVHSDASTSADSVDVKKSAKHSTGKKEYKLK